MKKIKSIGSSFAIAFSLSSNIPLPPAEWSEENRKYVICFFPLVGAVACLLYTSDAADDGESVDLGGRRIIKKNFFKQKTAYEIMPSLVGSEMCIRDRCGHHHRE